MKNLNIIVINIARLSMKDLVHRDAELNTVLEINFFLKRA